MRRLRPSDDRERRDPGGFTLIELLVVMVLLGLGLAIVLPNLGALVPSARLDGSGSELRRQLDWARSEARIQAKRMGLELDLEKARWRLLLPPEERLTSDQFVEDDDELPDSEKDWQDLEPGVRIAGAGDARSGLAEKGRYRIVFDEYGFTSDQLVVLKLDSDPQLVWSMWIQGLTGQVRIERTNDGQVPRPPYVEEGAF